MEKHSRSFQEQSERAQEQLERQQKAINSESRHSLHAHGDLVADTYLYTEGGRSDVDECIFTGACTITENDLNNHMIHSLFPL